jgi:hypothetical protein
MAPVLARSAAIRISDVRPADEAVKDALGFCTPTTAGKCTVVNINNKPVE